MVQNKPQVILLYWWRRQMNITRQVLGIRLGSHIIKTGELSWWKSSYLLTDTNITIILKTLRVWEIESSLFLFFFQWTISSMRVFKYPVSTCVTGMKFLGQSLFYFLSCQLMTTLEQISIIQRRKYECWEIAVSCMIMKCFCWFHS